MGRPENKGDREDQSNSYENEEMQHKNTRNQRNPLNSSWRSKARYRRDAAILRSQSGKYSTHSGIFSNVQRSTKCTCRMGISRIQNHQSIIQNKEGGEHNECYPMLCTHQ
ncbi:unnamed protein product [Schistosoma curassoni]|uniref:Ovule protein n=1 Tax=Schistosoma curassoni TaxID=6186 RepID=A0A183JCM6_9TREM|nr:unnamed protein product [Schistosoma curassoni]